MGDNGRCAAADATITSELPPRIPSPPPPPGVSLLPASAPRPTSRHPRTLTSATAPAPICVARQRAEGAIKELSGEIWRTWRAIYRQMRRPLRRPPLVTHRAAPLPLPAVADAPEPVTPRGIPVARRAAHRRRLWMSPSRFRASRREQQGPALERATDHPSETGAEQGGAGHASEAPQLLPTSNGRTSGVKTRRPSPPPVATSNRRSSRSRHRPPAITLEPLPPPRVQFPPWKPAAHTPPTPTVPVPVDKASRPRHVPGGNVGPPSMASSLTLPPGGYRTWFPKPVQTAARRFCTDTAHSGGSPACRGPGVDRASGRDG